MSHVLGVAPTAVSGSAAFAMQPGMLCHQVLTASNNTSAVQMHGQKPSVYRLRFHAHERGT